MNKYKEYQKKFDNYRESVDWLKNKDRIDSQSKTKYSLCGVSFSAEYCGQAYAGANNYHKSPECFNEAFIVVLKKHWASLSSEAIDIMKSSTEKALVNSKQEVQEILSAIESVDLNHTEVPNDK